MSDTQSRKWCLVINNPQEHNITREIIIERLNSLLPTYYCLSDEVSKSGTPHTHIFIYRKSPIRFQTLKSKYPTAHIEKGYGTVQENKDYVAKKGKWIDTEKEETKVDGSFYEYGEMPKEQEENNPLTFKVIKDLEDGKIIGQIVEESPELIFKVKQIEALKEALLIKNNANKFRDLKITYYSGISGVGKTHMVYDCHQAIDICRITNYRINKGISFDSYNGQKIIVFDNFCSSIPIDEMIDYLDIFPISLPARFYDRYAVYEYVYILSTLPLHEQYQDMQKYYPMKWNAFIRRITKIIEIQETGEIIEKEKVRYFVHENN